MLPLDYGNPGDRIPVLLDNGKIKILIAGNCINSAQIQVHGNYVFSASTPRVQTSDRDILKKQPQKSQKAIACQLVAASVWGGRINLNKVNTIPPHDIFPYITKIFQPAYQSWKYSSGLCVAVVDGSGTYDTWQQCVAENQSTSPSLPVGISPIPYVTTASNGDLVQSHDSIGNWSANTFRCNYGFGSSSYFAGTDNWFYAKVKRIISATESNIEETTRSFFDGSVKVSINGNAPIPLTPALGFTLDPSTANTRYQRDTGTISWQQAIDRVTYAFYATEPSLALGTNAILLEKRSNFSGGGGCYCNVAPSFMNFSQLYGFFVKVHDPDLPTIKILEIPLSLTTIKPYFIFLGTKAYFILKMGRVKNPQIIAKNRPWHTIKVIRLDVTPTALVKTSETDYQNPVIESDPEVAIAPSTHNFNEPPLTSDACLDAEDYRLGMEYHQFFGNNLQVATTGASYLIGHDLPDFRSFGD
jgi:hypothetical protein